MISKHFETILFDLDGTLVDSAPMIALILNNMRNDRGLEQISLDLYRQWSSLGGSYLIANALEERDPDVVTNLVQDFRNRYRELPTPIDSLFLGVKETLSNLSKNGIKIGLCSNKPEYLCRKVLLETGIINDFLCVVGGGTVKQSKPSREPIDYALKLLNSSVSTCVFVGDSTVDQKAAQAAGVPFVFFSGGYNDGVDIDSVYQCIDSIAALVDINRIYS